MLGRSPPEGIMAAACLEGPAVPVVGATDRIGTFIEPPELPLERNVLGKHRFRYDGGEAGTVLYSRTAIEPHRFDRDVRGRGRAGSRPAHRRRACDRHDPAPVSRDLHHPRLPRDGAGLLPGAPD